MKAATFMLTTVLVLTGALSAPAQERRTALAAESAGAGELAGAFDGNVLVEGALSVQSINSLTTRIAALEKTVDPLRMRSTSSRRSRRMSPIMERSPRFRQRSPVFR